MVGLILFCLFVTFAKSLFRKYMSNIIDKTFVYYKSKGTRFKKFKK